MDEVIAIALSSLIRTLPDLEQEELYTHLSKHLTVQLKGSPLPFKNPFSPLNHKALSLIHPSWITPALRALTERENELILSSLDSKTAETLRSMLLIKKTQHSLSSFSGGFFQNWLWQQLTQQTPHLLPIACLPQTPLNDLLSITSADLDNLIDLLSMHDLNTEIRHIIETAKLRSIAQILTKQQQQFLAKIKQKKEKVVFKPINLMSWTGNALELKPLLRHRGINRLSKALAKEHPSLTWYVKHRLNTEEATLFDKLMDNLNNPGATASLKEDVIALLANARKENWEATG